MFPPNTKILVVDDFVTMRKIIKKALHEIGFRDIHEAEDGKLAYDLLQKAQEENKPFDLILSDWNMPNTTGLDLLKSCRADQKLEGLAFIMITGESEQGHILAAVNAGVCEYILKPFDPATLKRKIEKTWNKHNNNNSSEAA